MLKTYKNQEMVEIILNYISINLISLHLKTLKFGILTCYLPYLVTFILTTISIIRDYLFTESLIVKLY